MVVYIPTTISGRDNDSADESFFRFDSLRQHSPPERLHLTFRRTQTVDRNDRNSVAHLHTTYNDIHQQDLRWTVHHTQRHIQLNSALTRSAGLDAPE